MPNIANAARNRARTITRTIPTKSNKAKLDKAYEVQQMKSLIQYFDNLIDEYYEYSLDEDGYFNEYSELLTEFLEDNDTRNLEYLGCGHYSHVYVCPWDDTKVIKVGHGGGGNGEILEDGWLSWAAFSMHMKTKGSYPHLPDIYNIVFGDKVFIALIERYDYDANARHDYPDSELMEEEYSMIKEANMSLIRGYPLPSNFDYIFEWMKHPMCPRLHDVHDGNFMFDEASSRVIVIDPCSSDYHLKDSRNKLFKELGINIKLPDYNKPQWRDSDETAL